MGAYIRVETRRRRRPRSRLSFSPFPSVSRRLLIHTALAALLSAALRPAQAQTFIADFGYVATTGNTHLATMNFGEKLNFKAKSWSVAQQTAYVYGKTTGVASANQLKSSVRADHTFLRAVGFFVGAAYERNRFAGFTMHIDGITGLTAKVPATSHDTLRFDAGGVLTHETRVDTTYKRFPAARAALQYKHSFGGKSYASQTGEYIPNLQSNGQYRINTESQLVAKMTTHFGVRVSYVVRYDSRPAEGFLKADRILTTGLQVSY
jgi:putative salt-induced outer membrane protein